MKGLISRGRNEIDLELDGRKVRAGEGGCREEARRVGDGCYETAVGDPEALLEFPLVREVNLRHAGVARRQLLPDIASDRSSKEQCQQFFVHSCHRPPLFLPLSRPNTEMSGEPPFGP